MNEIDLAYTRLALAVVLKAIEDACAGDSAASEWFEEEGMEWLILCGIDLQPGCLAITQKTSWRELRTAAEKQIRCEIREKNDGCLFPFLDG